MVRKQKSLKTLSALGIRLHVCLSMAFIMLAAALAAKADDRDNDLFGDNDTTLFSLTPDQES